MGFFYKMKDAMRSMDRLSLRKESLSQVFEEDYARKRTGASAENFNLVRKMAPQLINNKKSFKKARPTNA